MKQLETLDQKLRFDVKVNLLVGAKARTPVHFDDPWFQALVEQNVKAEYFEAHTLGASNLTGPTHLVRVKQVGLGDDQRF